MKTLAEGKSESDENDLAAQIEYCLLDRQAFTKTGVDFQFKLHAIAKRIRLGEWESPAGYSKPAVSVVNARHKESEKIRAEISEAKRAHNSYQQALRTGWATDPQYKKHMQAGVEESQLKLRDLNQRLQEVLRGEGA